MSDHDTTAPSGAAANSTICDSCGAEDEVFLVRRYYVTPEAWDQEAKVQAAGIEQWCFVCRTHYPHELLDGDDPGDAAAGASDAPPA